MVWREADRVPWSTLSPAQASLLDDLIDTDIAAIKAELEALQPTLAEVNVFPRTLIHHEPDNNHCQCGCALKRIGEDASEKLDYTPGVFTVERPYPWEMEGRKPYPSPIQGRSVLKDKVLLHFGTFGQETHSSSAIR